MHITIYIERERERREREREREREGERGMWARDLSHARSKQDN